MNLIFLSLMEFLSQELASDLKTEMTKELLDRNVSTFSMTPVKVGRYNAQGHLLTS